MKRGRAKGVQVHPRGICESAHVGAGTRVWAFAHVLPGARIGRDGNICDHVFVENDVVIGDRVTLKCFVAVWDGVRIEDDVFVGPGVSFTNDPYPRSKRYLKTHPRTVVRRGASLGAGSVILPGIEIGAYAMVGAGAVVTKSVAPFALVVGNPARPAGRVCRCGGRLARAGRAWRCKLGDWRGAAPSPEMRCDHA